MGKAKRKGKGDREEKREESDKVGEYGGNEVESKKAR